MSRDNEFEFQVENTEDLAAIPTEMLVSLYLTISDELLERLERAENKSGLN